jgi:flagellin
MSWSLSDSGFYNILGALNQTQRNYKTSMLRLSTGLRINSAADDPSGLVAVLEMESDLKSIQAASDNATRANSMLEAADGGMEQISDLVVSIKSLVTSIANDAGLTDDEKAAKQLEIDSAISSIDRIVNSTSFNGKNLLDGTYSIQTTGVDTTKISTVDITSKSSFNDVAVNVNVVSAADKGQLSFTGAGLSALNAVTLEIKGNTGTQEISFTGSSTTSEMASSINSYTSVTGVQAVASGGKLYFQSEHYGEDEFVSVETISGDFDTDSGTTKDYGEDAVITVNGQTTTVNGVNTSFNLGGAAGSLTLTESFIKTKGSSESFAIEGGGATFAITPNVTETYTIGIGSLGSSKLGNSTVGYLHQLKSGGTKNALEHAGEAMRIVDAASLKVSRQRANVGAFQTYTIGATQNMLEEAETSLSQSISTIRDSDYATEVANLSRYEILYQSQMSSLLMMSKNMSNILTLFGS